MEKKETWLSIVYCFIVFISFFGIIYFVFVKDWSANEQLVRLPEPFFAPSILSNLQKAEDILSISSVDIPKSKTGIVLVFDLNGIFLDIDIKKMMKQIGFSQAMAYARSKNISISSIGQELSNVVYMVLHKVSDEELVKDYDQVPACIKDWQTGKITGAELQAIVLQKVEEHPGWLANDLEKKLVRMLISNMLTPESFVATTKVVRLGFEALLRYKNQNHTLIAFFNTDLATITLLKATFPKLFALFDKVIISSNTHQIKPDKEAYAFFLDRLQKYGETIFMVEKEKNNYEAARSLGLDAVLITQKSDFLGLNSYPDFTELDKKIAQAYIV